MNQVSPTWPPSEAPETEPQASTGDGQRTCHCIKTPQSVNTPPEDDENSAAKRSVGSPRSSMEDSLELVDRAYTEASLALAKVALRETGSVAAAELITDGARTYLVKLVRMGVRFANHEAVIEALRAAVSAGCAVMIARQALADAAAEPYLQLLVARCDEFLRGCRHSDDSTGARAFIAALELRVCRLALQLKIPERADDAARERWLKAVAKRLGHELRRPDHPAPRGLHVARGGGASHEVEVEDRIPERIDAKRALRLLEGDERNFVELNEYADLDEVKSLADRQRAHRRRRSARRFLRGRGIDVDDLLHPR